MLFVGADVVVCGADVVVRVIGAAVDDELTARVVVVGAGVGTAVGALVVAFRFETV